MLLDQIKSAQLKARKERNTLASNLLTTLLGEAAMIGKNNGNRESTDSEVISTIKKFVANAKETRDILLQDDKAQEILAQNPNPIGGYGAGNPALLDCLEEIRILESFLPKQLTDEELEVAITTAIADVNATSIRDMGKVMKLLKERHDGAYDGSVVSLTIKSRLQ